MNTWSKNSLDKINKIGFNVTLKKFLLEVEKKLPFECEITDTMRTPAEQFISFKAGFSKCDGTKILSKHQGGNAFDIVPFRNKWKSTVDEWRALNESITREWSEFEKRNNFDWTLVWGGNWKADGSKLGWDVPHYEIKLLADNK